MARGITTLAALDELKITIPWGTRQLKDGEIINFENTRVYYNLQEIGRPNFDTVLADFVKKHNLG